MHLYIVRHGETDFNKAGVYLGRTDCSLNEQGITQAKKIGCRLKKTKFDLVISSPLKRCMETTKIITKREEKDILVEPRLMELDFGKWEGLDFKKVKKDYPNSWKSWCKNWKHTTLPEGESFMDMYSRVRQVVSNVILKRDDSKVLIVSHKGCLQAITTILLNCDDKLFWNFSFEHGCYSVLEINQGHCTVKKLNYI
ncbi:alpha-ribazole phosphatase [Proteinivorax hydrogeniformans]|uniref:Alpha-ribazole phosphatase n=1 Tax=Proteinivorax hydrogeniformans TaxID=1826727 RepID=A0AAU8HVD7_9FIRM